MTKLDKSDVLDGLFAVWDEVDTLLAGLPDEKWQAQTSLPGWTVHDVTAHLIGTESMLQGIATPEADIDVSTLKHVRNDIGVLNERWVRKLRGLGSGELLDMYRAIIAERRHRPDDARQRHCGQGDSSRREDASGDRGFTSQLNDARFPCAQFRGALRGTRE